MILQVHDELVIETKESELEVVKDILVRNMEGVISMKVPLKAEANSGKTWYDAQQK